MTTIECHFFACLINLLWKCVICQHKLWYDVSRQQNPVLIHKCTTISRKKMPKNKTCWVLSCSMLPRHFSKIIIIWLPNLQKKRIYYAAVFLFYIFTYITSLSSSYSYSLFSLYFIFLDSSISTRRSWLIIYFIRIDSTNWLNKKF